MIKNTKITEILIQMNKIKTNYMIIEKLMKVNFSKNKFNNKNSHQSKKINKKIGSQILINLEILNLFKIIFKVTQIGVILQTFLMINRIKNQIYKTNKTIIYNHKI
jgi:hypothetical protein